MDIEEISKIEDMIDNHDIDTIIKCISCSLDQTLNGMKWSHPAIAK